MSKLAAKVIAIAAIILWIIPVQLLAGNPVEEFGKATYYGKHFQGRKTASGERYDKNTLTCAHKTLPFGTKIRVTRLDNGKSVVVRVNDRGPYPQGRIVDLSYRAAELIGMLRVGVIRVKIEVLELPPPTVPRPVNEGAEIFLDSLADASKDTPEAARSKDTPEAARSKETEQGEGMKAAAQGPSELFQVSVAKPVRRGFGVQLVTLSDPAYMMQELVKIQKLFPSRVLLLQERSGEPDGSYIYKIMTGPFETRALAEARQKEAAKKGYKGSFIVDLSE